jgi:Phosphopantetheine attachment site.
MEKDAFFTACKECIAIAKRVDAQSVSIAWDEPFALYGLDSLDVMNTLLELESKTGISFDDIDLAQYNSIEKLFSLHS